MNFEEAAYSLTVLQSMDRLHISGDLQAVQPLPRHRPLQGPPPVATVGRGQDAGVGVRLGQLRGGLRHGRDRAPAGRRAPEEEHGVHASGPSGRFFVVVLHYSIWG